MNILDSIFGGGSNASDAANQYLNQIPGEAHNAYDPYINQGKESGTNIHAAFEQLMKDPQGFINNIMNGYKESDAYKYQSDKLGKSLSNTAASGGIAGTPLDQMNQGEQLQGLLSADQQQWLQNVLGRFDLGLQGEQNEATQGYDATKNLNDIISGSLNQQGGLAFNNAQQNNSNQNAFIKFLTKALGTGAGFAFGGPAGAVAGSKISKNIFN